LEIANAEAAKVEAAPTEVQEEAPTPAKRGWPKGKKRGPRAK